MAKIFSLCFRAGNPGTVHVANSPGPFVFHVYRARNPVPPPSGDIFNGTSVPVPDANCRIIGWEGAAGGPDFSEPNFVADGFDLHIHGTLVTEDPWPPV